MEEVLIFLGIVILGVILSNLNRIIKVFVSLFKVLFGIGMVCLAIYLIDLLFPLIEELLPVIIPVLLVFLGIRWIRKKCIQRKVDVWLSNRGIENLSEFPGGNVMVEKALKNHVIDMVNANKVISTRFYKRGLKEINTRYSVVTYYAIQTICSQICRNFPVSDTHILIAFLESKSEILLFAASNGHSSYLSGQVVRECNRLFETEGPFTRSEFVEFCRNREELKPIQDYADRLVEVVLDNMNRQGTVDMVPVEHDDFKDTLFISNLEHAHPKMIRRKISLDS